MKFVHIADIHFDSPFINLSDREGFGDKGNGIVSAAYQIYAMLLTISSIGVPNAISKLVSERVALRRPQRST